MMLQRLQALRVALWPQAVGDLNAGVRPDLMAVKRLLEIDQQEKELRGLQPPQQVELSGPGGGPVPVAGMVVSIGGSKQEYLEALAVAREAIEAPDQEEEHG